MSQSLRNVFFNHQQHNLPAGDLSQLPLLPLFSNTSLPSSSIARARLSENRGHPRYRLLHLETNTYLQPLEFKQGKSQLLQEAS